MVKNLDPGHGWKYRVYGSDPPLLELASKRLLKIPLPSEEGGDMITIERFVSILRGNISKPAINHLMVGDRYRRF